MQPLLHAIAAALLLAVAVWCGKRGDLPPWVAMLVGLGSLVYGVVAGGMLLDRKPKLALYHDAVDVIVCGTGPIRYREIVHVECFRVQNQAAVAIFVTAERQARLPTDSLDGRTPVFANELFAGPPIWFTDGALDCTAEEIAVELEARRRGSTGPLTARKRCRPG